ncbi:MAG: Ig-like domain-containing protein [Flavobacteriales bacterium]
MRPPLPCRSAGWRTACWALLALGCAQVREIPGGAKDESGPALIEALPPSGSTRFTGDRFVLHFNERVQAQRPKEGLVVSPPIDPPPTIASAGPRAVEVRWESPLLPNTTYSFAVGEAVKDLTEGNLATGLSYAFSTGEAIDSLIIEGTVARAFTGEPQEGVLVMAYADGDTASFTAGRPMHLTRTGPGGKFRLAHLPTKPLRIVTLKDLNGNYRYDVPQEEIGFLPEAVLPRADGDSTAKPVALALFQEASPVQQLREAVVTDDHAWRLALARPARRITIADIAREGGRLSWLQEWNTRRDTVLLWPSDTTALGEGRYAIATEEGPLDTLRYRPLRPMPYRLSAGPLPGKAEEETGLPRLIASRPLLAIDAGLARLVADTLDLPFTLEADTTHARALLLRASLPPGRSALLLLPPKTLRDIYGATNDTLRIAVGRPDPASLGTLRVAIAGGSRPHGALLLELVDAQGRAARSAARVGAGDLVTWTGLQPGNYSLRLIEDHNANGEWDTGSWRAQRQPERVWQHAPPIHVRAGWDLGIEWALPGD